MFTFGKIVLSSFSLLSSLAAPQADHERGGSDRVNAGICAKLTCTDAQRSKLETLRSELRKDNEADRKAIRELERELGEELVKAAPATAALDRIRAAIEKHRAQIADRWQDAVLKFHASLDAKQRAELGRLVSKDGLRALTHGRRHRQGQDKARANPGRGRRGDHKRR